MSKYKVGDKVVSTYSTSIREGGWFYEHCKVSETPYVIIDSIYGEGDAESIKFIYKNTKNNSLNGDVYTKDIKLYDPYADENKIYPQVINL